MMDYSIIFLIGRILFGGYFVMSGMNHFMKLGMLSGYAASKGVPSSKLAVIVTGLLLIVGGLGMLLGAYIQWAVLALALFFIPVTFKMHNFWAVSDPAMKMMEMVNFMKNMALLGAALMTLGVTNWPYSLGI